MAEKKVLAALLHILLSLTDSFLLQISSLPSRFQVAVSSFIEQHQFHKVNFQLIFSAAMAM